MVLVKVIVTAALGLGRPALSKLNAAGVSVTPLGALPASSAARSTGLMIGVAHPAAVPALTLGRGHAYENVPAPGDRGLLRETHHRLRAVVEAARLETAGPGKPRDRDQGYDARDRNHDDELDNREPGRWRYFGVMTSETCD